MHFILDFRIFLFYFRAARIPWLVERCPGFAPECLCRRLFFQSSHSSSQFLWILCLFSQATSSSGLSDYLCLCSIPEQIHGAFFCQELLIWGQNATYFSWSFISSLRGLLVTSGVAGHIPVRSTCSRSGCTCDPRYLDSILSSHGCHWFSPLQCLGVQFVFVLHHGTFGFHFAQWSVITTKQVPHSGLCHLFGWGASHHSSAHQDHSVW